MNAPYLILGLLCGLAIGYAFGWQYGQRLRKLRAAQGPQVADCSAGQPCTTCPDKRACERGCVRKVEACEPPQGIDTPPRNSELVEIHRVVMNVGGEWPDDERDPYTLRHVKWMARQLKTEGTDAARFRWLTEDHSDPEQRQACRDLLDRMSRMSYSAACMSIDVHRNAGVEASAQPQENRDA
jgi:hypothetical protein